jgi:hypothetical protein
MNMNMNMYQLVGRFRAINHDVMFTSRASATRRPVDEAWRRRAGRGGGQAKYVLVNNIIEFCELEKTGGLTMSRSKAILNLNRIAQMRNYRTPAFQFSCDNESSEIAELSA